MRLVKVLFLIAALCLLAGCGADETPTATGPQSQETAIPADRRQDDGPAPADDDRTRPGKDAAGTEETGTRLVVRDSEFGAMLFDSRRQAIYIFQNDRDDTTVCYGECAEAWPPVLTKGRPAAGRGVNAGLVGTIERRDGTRQVTYAGRPLYYYAHEEPGEVRCHNVNLNGGLWWVVGPDGKRRA